MWSVSGKGGQSSLCRSILEFCTWGCCFLKCFPLQQSSAAVALEWFASFLSETQEAKHQWLALNIFQLSFPLEPHYKKIENKSLLGNWNAFWVFKTHGLKSWGISMKPGCYVVMFMHIPQECIQGLHQTLIRAHGPSAVGNTNVTLRWSTESVWQALHLPKDFAWSLPLPLLEKTL